MCVHALQIAAMFRPVPTAPGHDVFPQGAHADCLYVLQDGEVISATSWHQFLLSPSSTSSCHWLAKAKKHQNMARWVHSVGEHRKV